MHLNRRDFLKSSGAIAGAAALPTILSCHKANAAPSNRINLGVIGIGKMCIGHIYGLLGRPDVRISALCDVESIRLGKARKIVDDRYRDRLGKNYGGCDTYGDFRRILDRNDIDAVLIATPTHWHAAQSVLSCQAGKDVYCEKPMTLSIHEGQAIIRAARHHHCVYQNGSQQRSDQKFRLACEIVRNGHIGKVKTIFINNVADPSGPCYLPAQPTPPSLDWDMWLGPAPWRPYHAELCPFDDWAVFPHWRRYSDFDGGGMTDWGAHHFDIAQWALGMDDSGPVTIIPPPANPNSNASPTSMPMAPKWSAAAPGPPRPASKSSVKKAASASTAAISTPNPKSSSAANGALMTSNSTRVAATWTTGSTAFAPAKTASARRKSATAAPRSATSASSAIG